MLINDLPKYITSKIKGILNINTPTNTPTNTNLNNSPRYIDINKPRTAQFSGANVNSNTYGRFNFKEGGSILARGNKLAKHKPTKLY